MTVAIDFDGTLCEDCFPEIGAPRESLIKLVKKMQANGVKFILWTCRRGDSLDEAVNWCTQHGLVFDAINKNLPEVQREYNGDTRKVFADYYVDDKNPSSIWYQETVLQGILNKIEAGVV